MKQARGSRVILVLAEDDAERAMFSGKLREQGYLVLTVADGAMALDIARNNPLSLIILDAAFVYSSGFEWCRQLRTAHETRPVPLLLMVASEGETLALRSEELPVDDYI